MTHFKLTSTQRLILSLLVLAALAALYYYAPSLGLTGESTPPPVTATLPPPTARPGGASPLPVTATVKPPFDFYLLSLSWSPDYCAESGSSDPQQCSVGRKLGFVLHGLWPQYQRGYPSYCPTKLLLTSAVKEKYSGLFPSASLYDHEWTKHGSCTGLTPEGYLALSKQIKESVVIPAAYRAPEQPFRTSVQKLKAEFAGANPGMSADRLAVFCSDSGRYLSELRLCFSAAGKPVDCSSEVLHDSERSCPIAEFQVRNVR